MSLFLSAFFANARSGLVFGYIILVLSGILGANLMVQIFDSQYVSPGILVELWLLFSHLSFFFFLAFFFFLFFFCIFLYTSFARRDCFWFFLFLYVRSQNSCNDYSTICVLPWTLCSKKCCMLRWIDLLFFFFISLCCAYLFRFVLNFIGYPGPIPWHANLWTFAPRLCSWRRLLCIDYRMVSSYWILPHSLLIRRFVFLVLALYLDAVLPIGPGTKKSPFFIFTWPVDVWWIEYWNNRDKELEMIFFWLIFVALATTSQGIG
jgi:hypothetical protein